MGPNASSALGQDGSPGKIFFATNFGAESQLAASYAVSLAQEFQASLTLTHAVGSPAAGELVNAAQLENHYREQLHALVPPEAEP